MQEDLDMYKQLFLNSERKREMLCKDILKLMAEIDQEDGDPEIHEKCEKFKGILKE